VGLFASLFSGGGKGKKKVARVDLKKRFDILSKLGQGSMSRVHRATDRKLGRTICLKVLDKEKTARFEARFATMNKPSEGAIITSLKHKHVVQAYEHGVSLQGEPFIVFELIDGLGLNFLIETKNPQLEGRRIQYLIQMAVGLDYIHKQGYLHRDICPRNVLITKDDVVKYIDFGLAIPLRPEFCQPGNRTGTANYLAPELIKRRPTDHRVDLFALGVTAYETITYTLPWDSTKSSTDTYRDHINNPGRDPRNYMPDLDEKVAKFLIKAIEREPSARFQTAWEMKEALEALPKTY
jgi:serine/threonine protein kinase